MTNELKMKEETVVRAASDAASGAAKLAGIAAAAGGAWGLQEWSHFAAIASALVAIIGGIVYSIKMVIEIRWINRVRALEVRRLEKELS